MRKYFTRPRSIPIALLLLCLAAYGLLVPWLGFFWDDWPYTWFARTLGPGGLIKALVNDRVFLAGVYAVTTTLLGQSPLTWQIFAILTRWLSILALWWTLGQAWPRQTKQIPWIAVLFAVYPGFLQHWISVVYSQAYLLMAATIVSIGLMLYAIRRASGLRYTGLTVLAIGLSVISLFSTEYFFGMELLRPLFIWFVLSEQQPAWRQRIWPALRYWLPYLIELVLFFLWRTFIFQSEGYQVQALGELSSNLQSTLMSLLHALASDSFTAGMAAWAQVFGASLFDFNTTATRLTWLVILVSLALLGIYLWNLRDPKEDAGKGSETNESTWSLQAILAGLVALLASVVPFWAANLPFDLSFPYNRFTLAMMVGSCLLVVGLVDFFIRTDHQKVVLLSILAAFAIGFQFQAANTFRRDQDNMRSFFWQLSWRVPAMKPGTLLLAYELPFKYYSDNSLTAPLNLIYAPDNHSEEMQYLLSYVRSRLKNSLPGLKPDLAVTVDYRATTFTGSTSNALVLHYAPPGCLRLLDPLYTNSTNLAGVNGAMLKAIPLSNFDRIQTNPTFAVHLPENLFGSGKTGSWCFYFEKAELARQMQDWAEVARLGDEARGKKLRPKDPTEWIVFVEGYAHTGQWQPARSLSDSAGKTSESARTGLCQAWERARQAGSLDASGSNTMDEVETNLKCSQIMIPQGQ